MDKCYHKTYEIFLHYSVTFVVNASVSRAQTLSVIYVSTGPVFISTSVSGFDTWRPPQTNNATTGAALLDNNETTAKSTSQDGGMAVNFG